MSAYVCFDSRLECISADILIPYLCVDDLQHVTTLNLHNQGLKTLAGIQQMTSLKTLIISFNHITKLEELSNLVSNSYISFPSVGDTRGEYDSGILYQTV